MAAGEIIQGVGSILSAGMGNKLAREQFDYQKNLQQQIFDREDNAVQRRMKDLEAAGFSKWNAVGQSDGAGAAVNTNLQHTPVNMEGAINGLSGLAKMMYNFKQQEANINLSDTQAKLLQSQTLTES